MAIAGSPVEVRGAEAVRALVTRGLPLVRRHAAHAPHHYNLLSALGPDGDRAMATSSVVVHQALADFPLQVILVAH